jgi:hypothetical protein
MFLGMAGAGVHVAFPLTCTAAIAACRCISAAIRFALCTGFSEKVIALPPSSRRRARRCRTVPHSIGQRYANEIRKRAPIRLGRSLDGRAQLRLNPDRQSVSAKGSFMLPISRLTLAALTHR